MYRTRRSSPSIIVIVCLGILIGIGYLVYEGRNNTRPVVAPIATIEPTTTLAPTLAGPTAAPTDSPREITDGARFYAPTAGISTRVIQSYLNGESWDIRDLGMYAGHLQGTAWMSEVGNIVLAGHVEMGDGRRGVFATVNELKMGDPLYLTQYGEERIYNVVEIKQVTPDDLSVVYPAAKDQLTLITCTDYDFVQNLYLQRLVVVAERVV
jgi:LPXTG-site transpeptidase (sortase) family protein